MENNETYHPPRGQGAGRNTIQLNGRSYWSATYGPLCMNFGPMEQVRFNPAKPHFVIAITAAGGSVRVPAFRRKSRKKAMREPSYSRPRAAVCLAPAESWGGNFDRKAAVERLIGTIKAAGDSQKSVATDVE